MYEIDRYVAASFSAAV